MSRSNMTHKFSNIPRAEIPRSSFDRSHRHLTTFDADYLVPIFVDDVIPGDTHSCNVSVFGRLATPLHPIMDNLRLQTFFFFVPYRLLWDNWEKFCGAQDNPGDSIDFTIPTGGGVVSISEGEVYDYMGLPTGNLEFADFSMLPFRAYNLIYNEWFRDQNLQNSVTVNTDNGPDAYGDYTLLKRGKRHDYFTSCLPWPQKGDAVSLPLGTTAPITGIGIDIASANVNTSSQVRETDGTTPTYAWTSDNAQGLGSLWVETETSAGGDPQIFADLSGATAATINDLRLAFQTQRLLERDARSGTRYVETIKAHYGVTVPDFRVQRPEYLGGGTSFININPVANTSDTASTNQGDLAAFGTVSGSHGFTYSATEHGVILGMANLFADITYSQGLNRYWSKRTRYDFYYPVLAMIGEQSVLTSEIRYTNTSTDDDVFGYQERYAEYRYKPSQITGLFRPQATASLEAWHLSEEFTSTPTLGATFIESNTGAPLDRAIAVSTEPHLICDFDFRLISARPMPVHGVPGNLDHF